MAGNQRSRESVDKAELPPLATACITSPPPPGENEERRAGLGTKTPGKAAQPSQGGR